MKKVVISGSFDDLRSYHVRFLEEAAKLGSLHIILWDDNLVRALENKAPRFPLKEREYFLLAIRYVSDLSIISGYNDPDTLPHIDAIKPDCWVVKEDGANNRKLAFCEINSIDYRVISDELLTGFPKLKAREYDTRTKKVLVTGCYDWLHSGHVRFFEEAAELGDLYVVVGHDANIELLKGEGHPLCPEDERRYMVQAIRHVKQALISSGSGWMDAEPEIDDVKPDMYVVNEDGDKPEKQAFCQEHGIKYVVLTRKPAEGLEQRSSTELRGF